MSEHGIFSVFTVNPTPMMNEKKALIRGEWEE